MAFDIRTAKPEQAKSSGFDISTASPVEQPVYVKNEGDFIPTEENLASAVYPEQQDRGMGESLYGAGETALSAITGTFGGAPAFIAATPGAIAGELSGRLKQGEGLQEASQAAAEYTFAPRSEAGQEYTQKLGELASVLPPVLGATPTFGMKGLPKAHRGLLSKSKSPLAKKIAEESTGNVQKKFAKKLGQDAFSPKMYKQVKEARRQGFDDGMTTVIANASPTDKRRMAQQVGILEKGLKDTIYQQENRPAKVAGESMLRKVEFIRDNNKKAGTQLGRIAKGLKGKDVDIDPVMQKFLSDLDDIDVVVGDDGALNFEGSRIRTIPSSIKIIKDTFDEINLRGDMDALEAHKFKKFLDENIEYGKQPSQGLSGKAARITEELRRSVNEAIGENNPKYKEANKRFSDTAKIIDELESVVGKKLDLDGKYVDEAFGTALRKLMNNTDGRANMMTAVDNITEVSRKYGGDFDDHLLTQMLFADQLDAMFGSGGKTALRSEVKKGNVDAAVDISQMTATGAAALAVKAGAKKIAGINEKNQLIAIKKLLSQK